MVMSLGFDDDLMYEQRTTPTPKVRKVLHGQKAMQAFAESLGSRLQENRKLHYRTEFQGIPISVENRRGSIRRGKDQDGHEWATKHKVPYGYIPGTEGPDGDAVDVFVGKNPDAAYAYVIHINNPKTGEYDEYKVFLGFDSSSDAVRCFRQHYDDPHKFFRSIDQIPMWEFQDKVWVKAETTERLLASLREAKKKEKSKDKKKKKGVHVTQVVNVNLGGHPEKEVQAAFLPAGSYAANRITESYGFSAKPLVHEVTGNGGQSHIFTSRHREHGVKGMKWRKKGGSRKDDEKGEKIGTKGWSSDKRAALAELPPAKASDLSQALRTENLHLRARMRDGSYTKKQIDLARERIQQNEDMIEMYDKRKESYGG